MAVGPVRMHRPSIRRQTDRAARDKTLALSALMVMILASGEVVGHGRYRVSRSTIMERGNETVTNRSNYHNFASRVHATVVNTSQPQDSAGKPSSPDLPV